MALSRKFLSAMGIEADKIDEIIASHTETVNALKEERDKYKADAEKLPAVQQKLDEALKNSKGSENDEKWHVKYDALKEEYDGYKKQQEADKAKESKKAELKKILKDIGVSEKRIDSVVRVTDIDALELDEKGGIKDVDAYKKTLKEEWSDFIVTEGTAGAESHNPPDDKGSAKDGEPSRAAQIAKKYYKNIYGGKEE